MLPLGFSISAARLGLPDVGLISYGEMLDQGQQITQAVSIPVIGDGDNGYGNAMNVKRTVKGYISAGFAGIILEDQVHIIVLLNIYELICYTLSPSLSIYINFYMLFLDYRIDRSFASRILMRLCFIIFYLTSLHLCLVHLRELVEGDDQGGFKNRIGK